MNQLKLGFSLLLSLHLLLITTGFTAQQKVAVLPFSTVGVSSEIGTASAILFHGILDAQAGQKFQLLPFDSSKQMNVDAKEILRLGNEWGADFIVSGCLVKKGILISSELELWDIRNGISARIPTASPVSPEKIPGQLKEMVLSLLSMQALISGAAAPSAHRTSDIQPVAELLKRAKYDSWFTDGEGQHTGGTIILHFEKGLVTGTNFEPFGNAQLMAQLSGKKIIGYYKANYGYGNFEFTLSDDWSMIAGIYRQVSNGATGAWVGERKKDE